MNQSSDWKNLEKFDGRIQMHAGTGRLRWKEPVLVLPPATAFFLVRHGETPANQMQIFQGSDKETEWTKLSEKGHAQSREAAAKLCALMEKKHGRVPVEVLCSPALRARETAQYFVKHAGLSSESVRILECLHEIKFGEMTGKTLDEICAMGTEHARFIHEYRRQGNASVCAGGSESFLNVLERVYHGLSGWLKSRKPGEPASVVVFTHMITACAIRVLLADQSLLEEDPSCGTFVRWRQIMANADPHHWDYSDRAFKNILS